MTIFNPEIQSIESDILYHETQLIEAQERLDQVKVSQAYSDDVISSLEDFFENTDPFLYETLKGHIEQMFEENQVTYNNDFKEVKKAVPQEIVEEEPLEEIIQDEDFTPEQETELDWQEQLIRTAPDIFYDPSSRKCFMGFSAKGRADQYGSYLSRILDIAEKYIVSSKPTVTTNTKYELVLEQIELESAQHLSKFNLKKEYSDRKNEKARELWRTTRLRKHEPACKPNPKLTPLDEIKLGDIVYLNSLDNQYKVLNKVELDGQPHIEVICIYNSERPSLVSEISYLKECYLVDPEGIQVDPQFKEQALPLTKEEEHSSALHAPQENAKNEQQEEVLTEDVNIYVPLTEIHETEVPEVIVKKSVPLLAKQKSERLTEADFPASPYNPVELTELEFGDIVTSTPHSKSAYEVIAVNTEYATAVCLYHQALPLRRGEQYTFANPYLVEKAVGEIKEAELLTDEPIPA